MASARLESNLSKAPRRTERLAAEDRREQILEAAMGCFAELGYRGTTTRALAGRVGISEAALYRYFPSKQSLYDAIIDKKMASPNLLEMLSTAVERRDDTAVFNGLVLEIFDRVDRDPTFLRILMFTALEGHALSVPFFTERVHTLREFVSNYVALRIEEGAFRKVDPVLASRAFLGMIFDHLNMRHVFREGEALDLPLEEVAETFVCIFLEGMRTRVQEGEKP